VVRTGPSKQTLNRPTATDKSRSSPRVPFPSWALCLEEKVISDTRSSNQIPRRRLSSFFSSRHQIQSRGISPGSRARFVGADRRTEDAAATMVAAEGNVRPDMVTIGVCVMEKKVRISPLRSLLFLFLFSVTWGLMELAGTWVLDGSWFLSRIVCPCSPTLCLICGLLIDSCSCSSSAYVSTGRLLLLDFSKNAAGVALFSLPNMFPSDRIIGFPFFRCSHLQWRRFSSGYARLENLRYASIFLSLVHQSPKVKASVRLKFSQGWVNGWIA
jgi:hypothetical protein